MARVLDLLWSVDAELVADEDGRGGSRPLAKLGRDLLGIPRVGGQDRDPHGYALLLDLAAQLVGVCLGEHVARLRVDVHGIVLERLRGAVDRVLGGGGRRERERDDQRGVGGRARLPAQLLAQALEVLRELLLEPRLHAPARACAR